MDDRSRGAEAERLRLREALAAARAQLDDVYESVRQRSGKAEAAIFRAHQALLDDPELIAEASARIAEGHSAAWAWDRTIEARADEVRQVGDERLSGRAVDIHDVGQRALRLLVNVYSGEPELPDTPVVCFAGDGGFYYHLAELETAARYGINLVAVVNNNGALNQEIPHFDKAYGGDPDERGREMWGFTPVNFAKVAESLGCVGMRVERPDEVGPAIERALGARRPVVIDVVTDHRAFSPKTWTGA